VAVVEVEHSIVLIVVGERNGIQLLVGGVQVDGSKMLKLVEVDTADQELSSLDI